jgi:glycosidase
MIKLLKKIAGHCDGVRCDMAMLVLNEIFTRTWGWANRSPVYPKPEEEFWTRAIREVPGLIYIAEAYWDTGWTLQQLGLDYVYDKRLYDRLKGGQPGDIYGHLMAEPDYQKKLLRFIENHDEMRSLTTFGAEKAKAAATLFSGLPGMKLYFHGQIEGRKLHLPLQIRQTRPEPVDPVIKDFYLTLLSIVDEPVFHDGEWQLKEFLPYGDDLAGSTLAYTREKENRIMLVICNLGPSQSEGRVVFQENISELSEYLMIDRFNKQSRKIQGKIMAHPGINFVLNGYESKIIEITPAS